MSEQELIRTKLGAVARRLRQMAALQFVAQASLWACVGLLVVLAVYKLFPIAFGIVESSFLGAVIFIAASTLGFLRRAVLAISTCVVLLLLLGAQLLLHFSPIVVQAAWVGGAALMIGACVVEVLRPVSLAAAAQFVDRKLSLKERLSSAIEFSNNGHGEMSELVLRDAAKHAETLNAREVLPLHLPRAARWVMLCLLAMVGLAFAPEYRTEEYKAQQRVKKDIKEEGEKIAGLVKRVRQNTKPAVVDDMQKELTALNDLGEQFQKVQVSKADALRDINEVADKLRKKETELGESKSLRTLNRRAAASAGSEPSAKQQEQLQQKIKALEKKLGSKPPSPEQIEKTKQELQKALDKLKANPDPNTPQGQQAREQMQKALDSAMQQAKDYGSAGESLDKAIEALKGADVDMVAKNVKDAVKDLEQMKQESSALAKAKQQAQQAGKDLAEQLSKGQAQEAKQTLEKFAQQMQQSGLSEAEKQEVAKELTKALDPAKDYGEVGDHLEKAVSEMAKNNQTGAANEMQSAAEALQKLMDKQGEAQQLGEMMEQLKQSQCQIATGDCKGGDQCPGGICQQKGAGTSGTPLGGKGRGFGDWPDEGNTRPPAYSENWDNTGLSRNDQDPRGVSDRDTKISGETTPTKVHGKLGEGGAMPGITIKGVSIKGQSNVEIEERTTEAKQEAEEALNKEQIPKSYQGQVKDYFDGLK